jgi:hypothetical protein
MFGKKSSSDIPDPVYKLIEDLSRAGESLARAVKAAREGVRGVTYEEWFIRKKIDEELAGVGMQVITKLK